MQKLLPPSELQAQRDCQVRAAMNETVIAEYIDLYKRNTVFPPLVVFSPNGKGPFLIADGYHRHAAALKSGVKLVLCEIYTGGPSDCLRFALGANATHGLQRTDADKRRAITLALAQWPRLSSREVARLCQVSDWLVNQVRDSETPKPKEESEPEKRTGKDGKAYPVKPRVERDKVEPADPAPTKPDKQWLDKTGFVIPEPAREIWERQYEAVDLVDRVNAIIELLEGYHKDKDVLFSEVVFSAALADLEKAKANIGTAVPHAVCPTCQGQVAKSCTLCSGRGMISKFRYETVVPAEIKKMRDKSTKK